MSLSFFFSLYCCRVYFKHFISIKTKTCATSSVSVFILILDFLKKERKRVLLDCVKLNQMDDCQAVATVCGRLGALNVFIWLLGDSWWLQGEF